MPIPECNPNWPEIQDALYPGQSHTERADLIARVFQQRLRRLLKQLVEDGVIGDVAGYLATVEWQKRGLPHAHILLIFKKNHRLETPDDFDQVVVAELPDPKNKVLFDRVTKHMIHGPCGEHNPNTRRSFDLFWLNFFHGS